MRGRIVEKMYRFIANLRFRVSGNLEKKLNMDLDYFFKSNLNLLKLISPKSRTTNKLNSMGRP